MTPIAGRMRMYTSGWPKTQNKCCQRIGMPPLDASKKFVPNKRSIISSTSAMVMAGKARTIRKEVMSVIQTNTGSRIIVSPGARILMIVTMKFKEPAMEEMPRICRPITHMSIECFGI